MKRFILLFLFILASFFSFSQEVKWMSLEEAFEKQKVEAKPLLIDVYTDWCHWCKKMDAATYTNPQIINYINKNYYAVKYDAETKDTLKINGKTYFNRGGGRRSLNDFSRILGTSSYPTTVFYDKVGHNKRLVPGYLDPSKMAPVLVYFKEELEQQQDINTFMDDFSKTFEKRTPDSLKLNKITWYSFNDGVAKAKEENKKIWVQSYDPTCVSCRVMDSTTYTNPFIVDYVNENYIPVKFDATSKETLVLKGQEIANPNATGYHPFMLAALKDREVKTPALFIFNEKEELIAPVNSYIHTKFAESLAKYFNQDLHLQQRNFSEFISTMEYESVK